MKIKQWIGVLCALLALPAWANPQNVRDAVQEAILRHPEVLSKWRLYQAAGHDTDAAQAGYYPRVDAQAFVGRERYDSPTTNATSYNHPGALLELRQMLFDGFATRNEVRRASYTRQARYFDLLATSDAIALETVRAYQDVLRYRRLVALARENWATHKELYDQIEERVAAGVGRRVDLEQATGRLALAESNWLTEAANLHDVSARYERLVGVQPAKTLADAPYLDEAVSVDSPISSEQIRLNPSFQAAVAGIRAARAEARSKDASLWPNLELRASQSVDRNTNGVEGGYNKGVVQLVLNYNLFKGGGDIARGRQYIEQLNANYDLRDKVCRDLRQTTRVANNEVRRNRDQLLHLQLHALSTEKAREAYRSQFDIGQRTLLDLLDTENEYFEARRAVVRAEHDLLIAQTQSLANSHRLLPALKLAPLENTAPAAGNDDQASDEAVTCGLDITTQIKLDREAALAERAQRPKPTVPVKATPVVVTVQPIKADASAAENLAIETRIKSWLESWRSKDFESYRASYSSRFVPPQGRDRNDWEPFRKQRLDKKHPIQISVSNIQIELTGPQTASVRFEQNYNSTDYADVVQKTLDMVKEEGRWKILSERVTRGKVY
jgi:outer membrane protein, adhesin transport system